jgi:hypothetical protein
MSNKNEGRKVEFYKRVRKEEITPGTITKYFVKEKVGEGTFLAFGIEVQELDMSCASYSTAIIELEDGSVKNVPVDDIVFKDNDKVDCGKDKKIYLGVEFNELGLSARLFNKKESIEEIFSDFGFYFGGEKNKGEIKIKIPVCALFYLPNFGRKTLYELKCQLEKHNIFLLDKTYRKDSYSIYL